MISAEKKIEKTIISYAGLMSANARLPEKKGTSEIIMEIEKEEDVEWCLTYFDKSSFAYFAIKSGVQWGGELKKENVNKCLKKAIPMRGFVIKGFSKKVDLITKKNCNIFYGTKILECELSKEELCLVFDSNEKAEEADKIILEKCVCKMGGKKGQDKVAISAEEAKRFFKNGIFMKHVKCENADLTSSGIEDCNAEMLLGMSLQGSKLSVKAIEIFSKEDCISKGILQGAILEPRRSDKLLCGDVRAKALKEGIKLDVLNGIRAVFDDACAKNASTIPDVGEEMGVKPNEQPSNKENNEVRDGKIEEANDSSFPKIDFTEAVRIKKKSKVRKKQANIEDSGASTDEEKKYACVSLEDYELGAYSDLTEFTPLEAALILLGTKYPFSGGKRVVKITQEQLISCAKKGLFNPDVIYGDSVVLTNKNYPWVLDENIAIKLHDIKDGQLISSIARYLSSIQLGHLCCKSFLKAEVIGDEKDKVPFIFKKKDKVLRPLQGTILSGDWEGNDFVVDDLNKLKFVAKCMLAGMDISRVVVKNLNLTSLNETARSLGILDVSLNFGAMSIEEIVRLVLLKAKSVSSIRLKAMQVRTLKLLLSNDGAQKLFCNVILVDDYSIQEKEDPIALDPNIQFLSKEISLNEKQIKARIKGKLSLAGVCLKHRPEFDSDEKVVTKNNSDWSIFSPDMTKDNIHCFLDLDLSNKQWSEDQVKLFISSNENAAESGAKFDLTCVSLHAKTKEEVISQEHLIKYLKHGVKLCDFSLAKINLVEVKKAVSEFDVVQLLRDNKIEGIKVNLDLVKIIKEKEKALQNCKLILYGLNFDNSSLDLDLDCIKNEEDELFKYLILKGVSLRGFTISNLVFSNNVRDQDFSLFCGAKLLNSSVSKSFLKYAFSCDSDESDRIKMTNCRLQDQFNSPFASLGQEDKKLLGFCLQRKVILNGVDISQSFLKDLGKESYSAKVLVGAIFSSNRNGSIYHRTKVDPNMAYAIYNSGDDQGYSTPARGESIVGNAIRISDACIEIANTNLEKNRFLLFLNKGNMMEGEVSSLTFNGKEEDAFSKSNIEKIFSQCKEVTFKNNKFDWDAVKAIHSEFKKQGNVEKNHVPTFLCNSIVPSAKLTNYDAEVVKCCLKSKALGFSFDSVNMGSMTIGDDFLEKKYFSEPSLNTVALSGANLQNASLSKSVAQEIFRHNLNKGAKKIEVEGAKILVPPNEKIKLQDDDFNFIHSCVSEQVKLDAFSFAHINFSKLGTDCLSLLKNNIDLLRGADINGAMMPKELILKVIEGNLCGGEKLCVTFSGQDECISDATQLTYFTQAGVTIDGYYIHPKEGEVLVDLSSFGNEVNDVDNFNFITGNICKAKVNVGFIDRAEGNAIALTDCHWDIPKIDVATLREKVLLCIKHKVYLHGDLPKMDLSGQFNAGKAEFFEGVNFAKGTTLSFADYCHLAGVLDNKKKTSMPESMKAFFVKKNFPVGDLFCDSNAVRSISSGENDSNAHFNVRLKDGEKESDLKMARLFLSLHGLYKKMEYAFLNMDYYSQCNFASEYKIMREIGLALFEYENSCFSKCSFTSNNENARKKLIENIKNTRSEMLKLSTKNNHDNDVIYNRGLVFTSVCKEIWYQIKELLWNLLIPKNTEDDKNRKECYKHRKGGMYVGSFMSFCNSVNKELKSLDDSVGQDNLNEEAPPPSAEFK